MTSLRLTDTDREALAFLAGYPAATRVTAKEVADKLGWNRRTGGPRLRRLVRLRLLDAKPLRSQVIAERVDGYAITTQGREIVAQKQMLLRPQGAIWTCPLCRAFVSDDFLPDSAPRPPVHSRGHEPVEMVPR